MLKRLFSFVAVLGIAGVLHSAGASAQGRVIVFGDSLSDNGNLFGATGGASPAPPYVSGRFSNGPVWVEQLFGPMGQPALTGNTAGNVNLAFGGARTDTAVNPLNPLIPGIPNQLNTFLGLGGDIGANDTVTIWGGANNIFQFYSTLPTIPVSDIPSATVQNSVDAAASNVTTIQAIAAQSPGIILVANLPNLAATPAFNTDPLLGPLSALATPAYNNAQAAGVRSIAAANPNVNIIQMDLNAAFDVIQANPVAFGLTNVTAACLAVPACAAGTVAQQNKFLFFDGVHPTQAGHALIAQYAGLLLDTSGAQAAMAPLAEAGLWANTQATNSIMDRMQGFISSQYSQRNGLHADILGAIGSQDARGPASLTPGYDYNLYGIRGGFDRKFGTSLYGVSATILRGDLSSSNLKADTTNFQADIYGSWSFGNMFVNADVGAGFSHIANIHRQTGFATVDTTASVNNLLVHGAVQAGYIAKFGPISLMPTARMQVINSNLGSFDETAPILAMDFDSRNTTAVLGGVRMRASMNTGAITLFAEVGYEDYLSYSSSNITAKLANNTAAASTVSVADPNAGGLTLAAGINGAISSNVHFDAQYGIALQNGNGQTHSGKFRLKVPF